MSEDESPKIRFIPDGEVGIVDIDAQGHIEFVLPVPVPFYGLEPGVWYDLDSEQQEEAKASYFQSIAALKSLYAVLPKVEK